MGTCASTTKTNIKNDQDTSMSFLKECRDQNTHKMLLLGTGGSGKSTIFRQMVSIYGKAMDDEERKQYKTTIKDHIINGIKDLIDLVSKNKNKYIVINKKYKGSSDYIVKYWYSKRKQSIQSKPFNVEDDNVAKYENSEYTEKMTKIIDKKLLREKVEQEQQRDDILTFHLGKIWQDEAIQVEYKNRTQNCSLDSLKYFMKRLEVIYSKNYIPTDRDISHCRIRTTGIIEETFSIDKHNFRLLDVGGQRNERKKWIHCFENVSAVIFVAALNEYDQTLYEDEKENKMVEALNLFDEIVNSVWFKNTSVLLFLNKIDIFMEKIHDKPLEKYFPEFRAYCENDPSDLEEQGVGFIEEMFLSRRNSNRRVYAHVTCATDRKNLLLTFASMKNIILRKAQQPSLS